MFTLTYTPNAYRIADNLLPIGNDLYESRPGFFQVVSDNINRAFGWNDACVMEIFGGVYVWHGNIFESIADRDGKALEAGLRFAGSRFQGLQSLGNREERIYVGNGSSIYYLHRNVIEGADVTGIEVTPGELEIVVDDKDSLTAIIQPSWALNKTVVWNSDNETVVKVDDGEIAAIALGSAEVTATTEDGGFSDSCKVTVIPYVAVTGIHIEEDELILAVNDTEKLHAVIEPENATNQDVYWRSDNLAIAAVSVGGTVTARAEGGTTIHVYTSEGHFSDSCSITITTEESLALHSDMAIKVLRSEIIKPQLLEDAGEPEKFYEVVFFENEFLDSDEEPYPLPKARFLATWRNRLWAGDGTHIIYHCRNNNPHHWEPLDAIPIQGGQQSSVTGLCAFGNRLIVSTPESLWQVIGDSPYNWEFQTIVHGHGAINSQSMTTDGIRLFHLDQQGVYEMGSPEPISEPIKEMFFAPDYDGQLLLDAKGEYLYLLIRSRLFAYHTYTHRWGEVIPPYQSDNPIKGLVMVGGQPGWYGYRGLWLRGSKHSPDVWLNGVRQPVNSKLRTWQIQPNPYGMASLNRSYISVEGTYQGTLTYRVYQDAYSAPIIEQKFNTWQIIPPSIEIRSDPVQTVYQEASDRVYLEAPISISRHQFEHELEATGYTRFHSFEPRYQFTERQP